jgi:hypothetical protein
MKAMHELRLQQFFKVMENKETFQRETAIDRSILPPRMR